MDKWRFMGMVAFVLVGMVYLVFRTDLSLISVMALMITAIWLDIVLGHRPKK